MTLESASKTADLLVKAEANAGALVILDLSTPGLSPQEIVPSLRSLAAPPAAILAFGPHVHEGRLAAAVAAGCDEVLARGQFYGQIDRILSRYGDA